MGRKYEKTYTTGEFASLFSVSKHTLFFYDKIGLFSPEERNNNGYRCYTASQINTFDTILTLRNIGIPIEQIRSYIDADSLDHLIKLLISEEKNLENRITELRRIKSSVSSFIELIDDIKGRNEGEVELRRFNSVSIYEIINDSNQELEEEWSKILSSMENESSKSGMLNQGSRILLDDVKNGRSSFITSVFIKTDEKANSSIPEGMYAVMYTYKQYTDFDEVYKNLLNIIDEKGFKPISDAYEEYAMMGITEEKKLTRIRIKIENSSSGAVKNSV